MSNEADASAGAPAPPPESNTEGDKTEESGTLENNDEDFDLNKTIYENFMNTSILPPWSPSQMNVTGKEDAEETPSISSTQGDDDISPRDLDRTGWKSRVDFAAKQQELYHQNFLAQEHDPNFDLTHLLEITLSTVGLLALGETNIPDSNFIYTDVYLRSLTTEHGDLPRNISDFLNYMEKEMEKRKIEYVTPIKMKPPHDIKVTPLPPVKSPSHIINRKKFPLSRKERAFRSKRRLYESVANISDKRIEDNYARMLAEELSTEAVCRLKPASSESDSSEDADKTKKSESQPSQETNATPETNEPQETPSSPGENVEPTADTSKDA